MGFASILCCGKRDNQNDERKSQSTWRIFSLKELHSATNYFNYDNKLGEGNFGSVYWGQLWDGSQIAVKRLKAWSDKAEMDFAVELETLARVRHKNLLGLRGYCAEGQEHSIVYDYMPNLNLLSHLRGQHSAECLLDWKKRLNIAIGSAEGIAYLHHHATPRIIHGDIKASNILLDSDFRALVADFGLAKLISSDDVITRAKVNLAYLAPEHAKQGKASESCDVYSFGILLLELISGKKSTMKQSITEWALPMACERKYEELADARLNGKFDDEELKRVILVALTCVHNQPEKRPTMVEVVELLKGASKDNLAKLENGEYFLSRPTDHGVSEAKDNSDFISEEKGRTIPGD